MRRCLELALHGSGRVAPNPLVGCVIVKGDRIIGEGFHAVYGEGHAEVNAIESVRNTDDLRDCTLYVSLEPCSHYGQTPPCSDLIVDKQIPRVVIAQTDPNPLVAGKGIERLRAAGIEVQTGFLEDEAVEMNRRFTVFHTGKRPYIILKWAESINGLMDIKRDKQQKGSYPISAPESRKLVHKWRSEESAILVGSRTVFVDDPKLNVRNFSGRDPLRVVLSGEDELPPEALLLSDGKPTLVIGKKPSQAGEAVEWIECAAEDSPNTLMKALYERNITSLLVEGGAFTLERFLQAGLWDEARVLHSSTHLVEGMPAPRLTAKPEREFAYGRDQILVFRNR
jgi:diaminohydroxyphosphoribosylaminopyrimidine deaminase/5-amino-6-(5-phosphoribosylamino)uracil reductase